jgi:hypothetical protein
MRVRTLLVGCVALLVTVGANAQTKHSGSLKCGKEDVEHELEVGDQPGHAMWLEKGSCTLIQMQPTMLVEGVKNKDYSYVDSGEATSTRAIGHGYGVHTTENGDKYFVAFHGETPLKDGKAAGDGHGTWSYTGGTGKLKGLKGKGTYKTIHNSDGSVNVEFVGEYQLPTAK